MKILLTATVASHICQFHLPYMEMFKENGHLVHVAAHDNLALKNGLKLKFCDKFIEIPFSRSPKSPDNIKAYKKLRTLLFKEKYDIIICNTPMGGIVTRLAAKKLRRSGTKVIYIAHGFHFFKGSSKKNWILFYPIEKYMAKYCDILVTVNKEDYKLAKEKFKNVKVQHIYGVGVSAKRYHRLSDEECSKIRNAEGLSADDFVILCTGELNANKNQKTIISAVAKLKNTFPNIQLLLAGNGPLENELKSLSEELEVQDKVTFMGYRTDLEYVVPAVDLIVSCSKREGLPLNIVEAMLTAKPVVASHNRGHDELVIDGETGFLLSPDDINGFSQKISLFINDKEALDKFGKSGFIKAQDYTVDSVKDKVREIVFKA